MKLWALSDLHVGHAENRLAVERIPSHPDDWLVLAGDLGETLDDLRFVLGTLGPRFRRLVWVPGNHELWTVRDDGLRGEAKYQALVAVAHEHGVATPEDPFPVFDGEGGPRVVAPLFTLYDYSFCPDGLTPDGARAWALEDGLACADERHLHPDPYPSREAWCAARCAYSEGRLRDVLGLHGDGCRTVLVDHFPLRAELAVLPRIPRFCVWCGTRRTHDWHVRFRADAVVYGHLHLPGRRVIDGVRFDEVSLGYPRQWRRSHGADAQLRRIL
jgi:3',5'-cyclic AMP phosphodiesterase CpdA